MPALKIATWNVNSLRMRMGAVLAFLTEHQPDVLCLQETKVEDALFPAAELLAAGWHATFHGQKSYNGVAMLTRTPPTDVRHGFATQPTADEGHARLITATVAGVRITNAYVPQGEAITSPKFAFKERFYAALQTELTANLAANPRSLLCGDLNIAADERDLAPNTNRAITQVMFTPQERAWLQALQTQTGLTDALRLTTQEGGIYSWFDYRTYARSPSNGWRIDYHLVPPALVGQVAAVTHHTTERAKPQPSDHIPVMLTLKE